MAIFPVTASGQVPMSTATPVATDNYVGAILRDSGNTLVRVATSGGAQFENGLLLTSLGQVVIVDASGSLPANTQFVNGLPLSSAGALCVSAGSTVSYSNGIPFAANGAVAGLVDGGIGALFRSGEQGAWFDPSDFSSMWQDVGGTVRVTAPGQPVGKINDKSGNNNHATFANAVLSTDGLGHYGITCNGTSTIGSTAAINFTATDKMTVGVGMRKSSDAAAAIALELSANSSANAGSFGMFAPSSAASPDQGIRAGGTTPVFINGVGSPAPISLVLVAQDDIAAPSLSLRKNGAALASSGSSQGTGTYGNYPLFIGARSGPSLFFNGILYGLVVRGAASTGAQVTSIENYLNSKTGAF